jgi:hypothetical protein
MIIRLKDLMLVYESLSGRYKITTNTHTPGIDESKPKNVEAVR